MVRDRLTALGQRIHLGMTTVGISSEAELARRILVSRQTVRRLLYDPVVRVDAVTLFRLADTVKLSARWILHGYGAPTARVPLGPSALRLVELHEGLSPEAQTILMHAATNLLDVQ